MINLPERASTPQEPTPQTSRTVPGADATPGVLPADQNVARATARKLDAEAAEVEHRARHRWIDYVARPILTALIAAVAGGAATFTFVLESATKTAELNEHLRAGLEKDLDRVQVEKKTQATEAAGACQNFCVRGITLPTGA